MWFGVVQRGGTRLALCALIAVAHTQETTLVDDSDPSIIYTEQWSTVPGAHQVGGTVKLTRKENATASLHFNGIGVSVFGTVGTPGGNTTTSLYSIDGNAPTQYTAPSNANTLQYSVLFYSSPPLADGAHTIVITNMNQNSWFWLDYLNVTQAATPISTPNVFADSVPSGIITTSPIPSSTLSTQIASVTETTASTLPEALDHISNEKAVPTGAAVGIALSGTVLVLVAIFFMYWWRRRCRETKLRQSMPHIDPFERPGDRQLPPPLLHGTTHPYVVEHFARSTNIVGPGGYAAEKASTIHRPRTAPPPDAQSPITHVPSTYGYPTTEGHG